MFSDLLKLELICKILYLPARHDTKFAVSVSGCTCLLDSGTDQCEILDDGTYVSWTLALISVKFWMMAHMCPGVWH